MEKQYEDINKEEAQKIRKELEVIINKIKTLKGKLLGYDEYVDNQGKEAKKNISRANVQNIQEYFMLIAGEGKSLTQKEKQAQNKKYPKQKANAEKFIRWAKIYIKYKKTISLKGKTFAVYFMDVSANEPQLGRAILKINKHGIVELKNLPNKRQYSGSYLQLENRYIFNLTSTVGGISLHIKIKIFDPAKDEIYLGRYITFEESYVATGTMILEKAKRGQTTPISISWYKNPDILETVDDSIKKYLSSKKSNYHRTPRKITDKTSLKNFIKNHDETWSDRFIEIEKPTLFIANPITSIEKNIYQDEIISSIIKPLENDFKNALNIITANSLQLESEKTFSILKKTRYFILILNNTKKHSFSLVQLGWAIAHCKYIMIFYEKGCLSKNMERLNFLNTNNNIRMIHKTNINNCYKEIHKEIKIEIQEKIKRLST